MDKPLQGVSIPELLLASLVDLKKCSNVDIYLQSPRYVSPKTRYEAAKRLPRVEVAKLGCLLCDAIFMRSYVCTRDIHKRVMFASYIV